MKILLLKFGLAGILLGVAAVNLSIIKIPGRQDISLTMKNIEALAGGEIPVDGCRKKENAACLAGTEVILDCNESHWYQQDNCMFEF